MPGFAGLVVFTLLGMAATVIMQSSHATLVLIITALAAAQITYENALALAIGANIGTTITAIIGSLSSNYQGKRLAAAHLIFNVATGAIAIVLISQLVCLVDVIAAGVGIAADDYTLKLAVFHTVFNAIGVAVMLPLIPRLVAFLQRAIPKKIDEVAEPKYINETAFDFPETLLGAVRQESLHLYQNAFEVLAHSINLHRSVIISEEDLDEHVKSSREIVALDLEGIYASKVKTLYAAILEFVSKAQTRLPPDFASHLYELRDACHAIAMSVKEIKQMRKNVSTDMVSGNEDIRREFNALRVRLASVMRAIHVLEQSDKEDRDVLALDEFKVAIDENNVVATGAMDALIREGRITAVMASSLMNDQGHARNLVWHLADIGKALFGTEDVALKEAEEIVVLTEEDIDAMREDSARQPVTGAAVHGDAETTASTP